MRWHVGHSVLHSSFSLLVLFHCCIYPYGHQLHWRLLYWAFWMFYAFENNMCAKTTRQWKFNNIWLELRNNNAKGFSALDCSCSMIWHNVLPNKNHQYSFVLCIQSKWSYAMIRVFFNKKKTEYFRKQRDDRIKFPRYSRF